MPAKIQLDFCLLIPCYNNLAGLVHSLDSVKYSGKDYLIVIIDDGSDTSVDEESLQQGLTSFQPIVLLKNDTNSGITFSLNKGLHWILSHTESSFIARLDCGDICSADRFDKQVSFLHTHPAVGLLGSWCRFQEPGGAGGFNYTTPVHHSQVLRAMHFRNVFIHPTVMFRRDVIEKNKLVYPDKFLHAEDYAFFWSILRISQSHILNEFLVICEINKTGISYKNRGKQLVSRLKVVREYASSFFLKFLSYFCLAVLLAIPASFLLRVKKMSGNRQRNVLNNQVVKNRF